MTCSSSIKRDCQRCDKNKDGSDQSGKMEACEDMKREIVLIRSWISIGILKLEERMN